METKRGRAENVYPHSSIEARANGRKGGIASGVAKREKKLVSAIYGEFLAEKFNIQGRTVEGSAMIADIIGVILARADSASVSMLKEIREATEGSKLSLDGQLEIKHTFDPIGL